MNDELVERLRTRGGRPDGFGLGRICDDAADEIERLTAQLAEARESERAAVVAKQAVLDKIDDVVRSFSDGDGYFLASQIRAHLAAMGEPAGRTPKMPRHVPAKRERQDA